MASVKKKDTFESSLEDLENILHELEAGGKSLDESLKLFEKGVGLSRTLTKQLEEAKHKVEVLIKDGDGYKSEPLEK